MPLATGDKGFSVGFDPLDGSSIVDANFAVGKLFAVVDFRCIMMQFTADQRPPLVGLWFQHSIIILEDKLIFPYL